MKLTKSQYNSLYGEASGFWYDANNNLIWVIANYTAIKFMQRSNLVKYAGISTAALTEDGIKLFNELGLSIVNAISIGASRY